MVLEEIRHPPVEGTVGYPIIYRVLAPCQVVSRISSINSMHLWLWYSWGPDPSFSPDENWRVQVGMSSVAPFFPPAQVTLEPMVDPITAKLSGWNSWQKKLEKSTSYLLILSSSSQKQSNT